MSLLQKRTRPGNGTFLSNPVALLSVALSLLVLDPAHSQTGPWAEQQKVNANDAVPGIGFGDSGALGDDIALIGATANGLANLSAGAVYALKWNENDSEWQHAAKLTADDGALDDRFGWSVAIDGDVAVVGAPDDDDGGNLSGSAYVFRRSGDNWQQEQKLTASDATASDRFGRSVAVSGDVAIVGAPDADGDGGPTGAAYIFRWNGNAWQQELRIDVGSFATIAGLGAGVSASGDRVLVGVPREGPGAQNRGAAYVFRWDGNAWQMEQRLAASDEDEQDMFGASVSLRGDVAIIGAPQDENAGDLAGSSYVFRFDGNAWQQEQKLLGDDTGEGDRFGFAVTIRDDVAVVGALDDDNDGGSGAGGVYVFQWDGNAWTQQQKLTASDAGIGDHFGESVAMNADWLLSGASNADDGGESTGSAYLFSKSGSGTAVEEVPEIGDVFSLRAYPNPFAQRTTISYALTKPGPVRLTVYDVRGRQVKLVVDALQPAGSYSADFSLGTLPSGIYLVHMEAAGVSRVSPIVHIQ